MILKLLLIAGVSAVVFWGAGRILPRTGTFLKTRILPLILSPLALPVLKRVFWFLLRLLLFRR
jgi:hypothetical protein